MESCKKVLTFSVHKSYIGGAKGGIVILSVYINKKCKKQCKSIKKRKGDLNAFPLFLILCIYTISKPIR